MYVHKTGRSFSFEFLVPEVDYPDGYFIGWTVSCQVRTLETGVKVADVVCTWDNPLTTRNLLLSVVDTEAWPLGVMEIDVKFRRTSDGLTETTNTAQFVVTPGVTRAD